jgi:hypothetical protein
MDGVGDKGITASRQQGGPMRYINCGVMDAVSRERILTKKRLKELAVLEPARLLFDPTSIYEKQGVIRGDTVPADVHLSVCGPDPYCNRTWWAQIELKDGKLVLI